MNFDHLNLNSSRVFQLEEKGDIYLAQRFWPFKGLNNELFSIPKSRGLKLRGENANFWAAKY